MSYFDRVLPVKYESAGCHFAAIGHEPSITLTESELAALSPKPSGSFFTILNQRHQAAARSSTMFWIAVSALW
jgi:hypothetical protein